MAFCKFVREFDGTTVFINPAHVVAVLKTDDGTRIVTDAGGKDGAHGYTVNESVQQVVMLLEQGA
ncbi:hypothetical protein [Mesorhizobium japonicum]|uniref:hypothetical protein n=1 Tax=Mesorhizobium japonicum TaxID=2066070 RepID=UPI0005CAC504|nr:hypothetical protein [Mesorhizobium japonicum]